MNTGFKVIDDLDNNNSKQCLSKLIAATKMTLMIFIVSLSEVFLVLKVFVAGDGEAGGGGGGNYEIITT